MQARVELRLYRPSDGEQVGVITSWNSLNLVRTINHYDVMTLSLVEDDPRVPLFELDTIIEVRRRLTRPGAEWYTKAVLLHRSPQNALTNNGRQLFTSYSRSLNDLLHRRVLGYTANTAFTLKSGPGETVMKEFVNENAGPGANNAARQGSWDALTLGLSIEPDNGQGLLWANAASWRNLLDLLTEIAVSTGVDFTIVRTGPRTFEFRTYYPQLGVDRSAYVLFDPEFNNMTDIVSVHSRTEEANAVLVLGQGERDQRRIYPAIDSAYLDSPWNLSEITRDARNQPTLANMITDAEKALNEFRAQHNYTFRILQTPQRQYGATGEYWFGDVTKASYRGSPAIRKIVGVTLNIQNGVEDIDFELSEFPSSAMG